MPEDYPRTLLELERRFGDESACRDYLAAVRWPEGFVCPGCQGRRSIAVRRGRLRCAACRREVTVAAGTIAKTPKVKFTGAAKPGGTLTASAGKWPAATTLSYQWLRNGTAISGATSSTYSVKAGDAGASISLTVTGTLTGYNTLAVTSAAKVIKAH